MQSLTLVLEKIKYKEAIKYADTLAGVSVNKIVSIDEIPPTVISSMEEINKIHSISESKIENTVSMDKLSIWVISMLQFESGERVFFKPNGIYWKFWLDINLIDLNKFITNYLLKNNPRDFYLYAPSKNSVLSLLDEEHSFEFFVKHLEG